MRLASFKKCLAILLVLLNETQGWTPSTKYRITAPRTSWAVPIGGFPLKAVPGADIEQPPVEDDTSQSPFDGNTSADSSGGLATRGKKNEIDFTVAPADVSLSQAYGPAVPTATAKPTPNEPPVMSLTLALNNASNRVVRRIILARSWPSAEALNLSLRQVAEAERRAAEEQQQQAQQKSSTDGPKCPVPRPILNVLTRKRRYNSATPGGPVPTPRSRTDEQYVADQLRAFRDRYGNLANYNEAEDYLASILSLATSGVESERAKSIVEDSNHSYHDSYRRLLGVLRTVGVIFETDPATSRRRIAKRLNDSDICLSMLDRIQIQREEENGPASIGAQAPSDEEVDTTKAEDDNLQKEEEKEPEFEVDEKGATVFKPRLKLFRGNKDKESEKEKMEQSKKATDLTKEDLGGVLLSAEEPSMTRQLNILSNIVLRALLFGGDQELLVLAETLDADRSAFVDRWYPNTGGLLNDGELKDEKRPGVQYLNNIIDLLRECYDNGIVVDLQPSLPLSQSYANAYERLVAMAVELGSGYLKPAPSPNQMLPKPRTAKEELGRLALWESRFRQAGTPDISPYPEDMEGVWEVRDEVGGETIGTTKVTLGKEGQVIVNAPLEGLRWRLDPGPTHLDTCTFQVLNTDGTILQYRGFIDRGARLEARFSKRAMRIRGSVMFQMRDGSLDYYKDILPINYREGTTKFVMTKMTGEA